jgi:outer membrane lipoprotein-sorting protein
MKKAILTFTLMLGIILTQAQTADQIIGEYFKSIGGVELWQNLESIKMSGTSSMQGMEFPMTIYSKRPNLEKVEVLVQGMLLVPQAYDGKIAWTVNPFMGDEEPTKLDEETTRTMASEEFENEFINYKKKGHSVEFLGEEEFESKTIYKIRMTKKLGGEILYYFDAENYLPVMIRAVAESGPMKGQAVETYMSDYREVDGAFLPFAMESKVSGSTLWSAQMDNVEINSDLPDKLFKFPGEEAMEVAEPVAEEAAESEMDESMEKKEEEVSGEMTKEEKKAIKEEKKAKKKEEKAKNKEKAKEKSTT